MLIFVSCIFLAACGATTSPVQITPSGATSLLSASPINLSFGDVNVGNKSTQPVTLTNTGTSSVTVSQATLNGAGFSTSGVSFPLTVTAGKSAAFNVVFAPTTPGTFNGSVALSTNASDPPGPIPLSGTGITTSLSASPLNLSFGSVKVGSSSTLIVNLANTGTNSVTVSQVTVTGAGFSTSGLSLPLTVTSGNSAVFNVVFAPTTAGTFNGSVALSTNANNSPGAISLAGTGIATSLSLSLSASPLNLSFGNVKVGSSSTLTVTLTNTGTGSVTVTQATLTGAGFGTSGLSLPLTLTSGNGAAFNATFSPTSARAFSGSISVASNASNSPVAISLAGTGITTSLSVSPLNLSFGNVKVGSSSTLTVTLTNTGTSSVTVTKATEAGAGFSTSGLSLPLTLTSGKSGVFNANFSPTSASAFSGSISVASNASTAPQTISLSGTGTSSGGGGGSACGGTPLTQTPSNVTSQLSQVGTGVTVTQATNDQENWNTYADVPAYSALAKVMTYDSYALGPPNTVSTANLDGSSAQTISGNQQGEENYVTLDGKFVYYQGQNPDQTGDIYAVPISQSGSCQQIRLTNTNWTPVAPLGSIVISTSSIDTTTGKNGIAYSGDTLLHRVLDDGTALPTVTLGDPEKANVFHRMRLNPVFPNVLWYKRDQPNPNPNGLAEPEIWVVNLNSPNTVYSVAGTTPVDHATWSPDGTQLGYHIAGVWYLATVLKSNGTFAAYSSSTGFTSTKIGPPSSFLSTADANYCNWAPDGSVYVCTGGAVPGSPVYLMSLDGTQTKYLSATDSTGTVDAGIPKARFLDIQHIMFSSDRSGTPQIHVIKGFTTTFP